MKNKFGPPLMQLVVVAAISKKKVFPLKFTLSYSNCDNSWVIHLGKTFYTK